MTAHRKDQHVSLASADQERERLSTFDEVNFLHHALGSIAPDTVSTEATFAGATFAHPFYINAMTGGSQKTGEINRQLALAAAETGVAIASGSMSILHKEPEAAPTFQTLRKHNPEGFLMANLNANATVEQAKEAIGLLEANALQLHVNPIQEVIMPEGDTDYSQWLGNIEAIVSASTVPVIIKEVGFGLSRRTLRQLIEVGVTVADVSGNGGTNFARIENARRSGAEMSYLYGWGIPTVSALLDATGLGDEITVLASGGIRNPLDVLKVLALGAQAAGVSGTFLKAVLEGGAESLTALIRSWQQHITALMAVLGAKDLASLTQTDLLLTGSVREYCHLRGIDASSYSRRSSR